MSVPPLRQADLLLEHGAHIATVFVSPVAANPGGASQDCSRYPIFKSCWIRLASCGPTRESAEVALSCITVVCYTRFAAEKVFSKKRVSFP